MKLKFTNEPACLKGPNMFLYMHAFLFVYLQLSARHHLLTTHLLRIASALRRLRPSYASCIVNRRLVVYCDSCVVNLAALPHVTF